MTSLTRPLICLLAAAAASMAACSGDDGSAGTPGAGDSGVGSTGQSAAVTSIVSDSDQLDPLVTDPRLVDPLTTDPVPTPPAPASTVAPAEELPELVFTTLSAGPLQLEAGECAVEGLPADASGAPDGPAALAGASSLAIDASRAYLPTEEGVIVFALDTTAGCTMSIDTSIGEGGLLATTDPVDSVAVSATGRLAATGLFGSTVFDLATGGSFPCADATGEVDITGDGTRLMTSFPGSPVEEFVLSDAGCTGPTEVALPADIVDPYYVAYDGSDLFVGGLALDQAVYAGRASAGALQWKIGNVEPGGAGWIGWVHGMAPCAGGVCVLDTNTDKLVITDALGGLRAEFAVSGLIGTSMFYETIELGADGALYLLATTSAPDGAGGRTEGGYVVRIVVTG